MNRKKNSYTEVYTILQDLNEEEYNKIPVEVIEAIKINRNEEYNYELDDEHHYLSWVQSRNLN